MVLVVVVVLVVVSSNVCCSSLFPFSSQVRSGPSTVEAQWYTCRMIMPEKMSVTPSTTIVGEVNMTKNPMKSYDFNIKARIEVRAAPKPPTKTSAHTFSLNNHSCSAMGTMGDEGDWTEASGAAAEAAAAYDVSATWFIGTNGEQTGPFNEEQIEKLIHSGSTSSSTYVWRDGMVDWMEISAVETFKHHYGHQGKVFRIFAFVFLFASVTHV